MLEVQGDKALLISRYAIEYEKYNTGYRNVTWDDCMLRTWLNQNFLNDAFSDDEKKKISTVTVSPDQHSGGKATQDKIFLLSVEEAEKYFGSNKARKCSPTDYVVSKGEEVKKFNGNCWWYLRAEGSGRSRAIYVDEYGEIDLDKDTYICAIRPAIWIERN